MERWKFSRKTPGRYNAIGGFRMWREPKPAHVLHGRLIGSTPKSWLVLSEDGIRWAVSRKHASCDLETNTWTIPGWLWAKMNEGER